jgi:hypothetical protein
MITEVSTKYQKEFVNWLNNETLAQQLGMSDVFNWQWFITMTSKDTMTKNGARLAMTRFLGLYLKESKTDEVTCFWVAEPHAQGKNGYHIHALLQTKWPTPQEKSRSLQVALMLDDIYQRAMSVTPGPIDIEGRTTYYDKWGKITSKHRFRAEPYSNARGAYCAKYITKGFADWEFARVSQSETQEIGQLFTEGDPVDNHERDCKGNWNKKLARQRTSQLKRSLELQKGEKIISLRKLLQQSEYNYVKLSKFRHSKDCLELTHIYEDNGKELVF